MQNTGRLEENEFSEWMHFETHDTNNTNIVIKLLCLYTMSQSFYNSTYLLLYQELQLNNSIRYNPEYKCLIGPSTMWMLIRDHFVVTMSCDNFQ